MPTPPYVLIGGPLDGATAFPGIVAVFSDSSVVAQLRGPRPRHWRAWPAPAPRQGNQGHCAQCDGVLILTRHELN